MQNPLALTRQRRGAALIEYAILLGLLAVAALGAVKGVGTEVTAMFSGSDAALSERRIGGGGAGTAPIVLTGGALPDAEVGEAYNADLTSFLASGGDLAWSLAGGALPAGFSLAPDTGRITGTPSGEVSASFDIVASSGTESASGTFTIEVGGAILDVVQIAAGGEHTCAVVPGGGVKCWGHGDKGQIGDGNTDDHFTPQDVTGLGSGVRSVSAGVYHSCAVTVGGEAKCWGSDEFGQLGNAGIGNQTTPQDVEMAGASVASVAAGPYFTCAVMTAGGARCWGQGQYGQLGDGDKGNHVTPQTVDFAPGVEIASIAVGGWHACAVTTEDALKCWGRGGNGQIGDGDAGDHSTPQDVAGLPEGAKSVTAGSLFSCAVTTNDVAKCWGDGTRGRLGDGDGGYHLTPETVLNLNAGVVSISASTYHACAVTTGGTVKCWGRQLGQLGDGGTTHNYVPDTVLDLPEGATAVSAAGEHNCVVTTEGGAKCWGDGGWGRLGHGYATREVTPVSVAN